MVACLEEIAYRMGYISAGQLSGLADAMGSSAYGQYLRRVLEQESEHEAGRRPNCRAS